ncbi:pickpocket protein 11-like [Coccinella septempunctata]|uniref:pickpocket protein 11-like n=1 Tax=Coccinella septempunctata TaxID=41139 RepID=UPI001D097CB6|nr:pickpocket protein 11-like [Coccinella septempunctata]
MFIYFYESYKAFNTSAVSFVTETTYLNWNTSFPAISICEIKGADVEYDETEDESGIEEFIHDVVYFTGDCYSCSRDCQPCEALNFTAEVLKRRKPCNSLFRICKWNDIEFDCCEKFLPLETEYGICYSLNSLHTRQTSNSYIDLVSNRKNGAGGLYFQTVNDVRMYIHATEDVPFINADPDFGKDILVGESSKILFNIIEIENDENVETIPIEQRGCRYAWEVPSSLKVHRFYSYSSCVVQCRAEAQRELCGCTHHHMPLYNREGYCNIQGLKCLTDQTATLNALHAAGFEKPGLVCDCVPSCNEPEYEIVSETRGPHPTNSEVSIKLQSLPTQRLKRIVTRTTMDLVVSFGGTAGLFIGASLLSIVEAVYLLFLRKL